MLAQEPPTPNSPESAPLSEDEIKSLIFFTEKFSLQVEAERLLRESIEREKDFAARERALAARELENEKRRTELAEEQAQKYKEDAAAAIAAFERVTRGRSFGCALKKIFTVGLARC